MTTVILAEKPSQALAYAQAFSKSSKEDGFFKIEDPILKDEAFITFGFGHLVELDKPGAYKKEWEKWNLENLPIIPSNYTFTVPTSKIKQFNIVKKLLNKANTIVIATDSDREGENIAWSIIHKAGAYNASKTYKRLWINSLEKEVIRDGFKNLRKGEDYLPYYQEAQTRQIADWLIGMNGSPLYSLYLQEKGINESFSLGRVQTPTLFMIYQRQLEIQNFIKKPYFEIEADITTNKKDTFKVSLKPNKQFDTEEQLKEYIAESKSSFDPGTTTIKNVETKEKKTSSPMLFSLSTLQTQANQQFKASASETLEAVQRLYEKRFLTYPRTDTNYITHNEFNYLKQNLSKYMEFLSVEADTPYLEARTRYVNDKKVQEHHAIILTKQVPGKEAFEKLKPLQQNIYMLIAKTTLAMFLEDYIYSETVIDLDISSMNFQAKGNTPLKAGWKELFKNANTEVKESLLPKVAKNEEVTYQLKSIAKETKPPKYYTEGTLITAMKTAGKMVDDEKSQEVLKEVEGIGTEATRANIIETLKEKSYIVVVKNKLFVTAKGRILCRAVAQEPLLTSAEMTAKWETYLKKIGMSVPGVSQEKFLGSIEKFIKHLITKAPEQIEAVDFSDYLKEKAEKEKKESLGKCPMCDNGTLKKKKGFYGCSNYPNCHFSLWDNFRNKKLTQKNLKELIEGKETTVAGVKAKEGSKTYNANIRLVDGKLEFVGFAEGKPNKTH